MDMDRRLFCALSAGALCAPGLARAQNSAQPLTLIELFTSQGCSSCPPADALMLELSKEAGLLPLTFAVEIWDYLGWKDTLAKPAFTRRQKAYAAMVAGKRVYTPQAIVNGKASCIGSDLSAIRKLRRASNSSAQMKVEHRIENGHHALSITLTGLSIPARLLILPVADRISVPIGRGENSGHTITYANVVRDILDHGAIENGSRRFTLPQAQVSDSGANALALIVQGGSLETPGEVFASAFIGPAAT